MALTVVQHIILFLGACIILALSGGFVVKTLEKISSYLRLGEFVIAFILVSFATSIPELFIGISAALANDTALALGNVIGSNIVNVTLVVGIVVLIVGTTKIKNDKHTRQDLLYVLGIAALPLVLMWDHQLSKIDGILLTIVFFVYMYKIYLDGKHKLGIRSNVTKNKFVISMLGFIAGLAILFYSARLIVMHGTELSIAFALPPILIGLFMVAIGTSLPELAFTYQAAKMKHGNMVTGNAIGSTVTNSTLVLGVTAMIMPITANYMLFLASGIFMILVTGLFLLIVEKGKKLTRWEGLALVLLYLLFFFLASRFV